MKKQKTQLNSSRGKLFIVLKERGLTAYRSDIICHFTGGAETSSSVLTVGQLIQLIPQIEQGRYDWVRDGNQPPAQEQAGPADTPDMRNNIRRRIISQLITLGAHDDKGKPDMKFIYAFILKFWKSRFNDIPAKKLSAICAVIETDWRKDWEKKKAKNPNYTIKQTLQQ